MRGACAGALLADGREQEGLGQGDDLLDEAPRVEQERVVLLLEAGVERRLRHFP